jgi:hypothetical protein
LVTRVLVSLHRVSPGALCNDGSGLAQRDGMAYQLGVDLGTTFTAAAVAKGGRVEVTTLGPRSGLMPSAVYLRNDGEAMFGEAAWRRRLAEPDCVAREFKRHVGDPVPVVLDGVPYGADRLMAILLRRVVDTVAATEGEPAEGIVITYPAVWGPYKRDVLAAAFQRAEVEATTISEPEAVATNYAFDHRVEPGQVLAVYSLGAGCFEATVLRKTQTGFEILGDPEGIDRVGDLDEAVFDYVIRQIGGLLDVDTTEASTAAALARLRTECIEAKEALSYEVEVSIPVLLPSVQTEVRLRRADFEAMARPLLEETTAALSRVVRSAKLVPTDLSAVLLAGGSTRIPLVRSLLSSALGPSMTVLDQGDHAVAFGAALVAAERTAFYFSTSAGPVAAGVGNVIADRRRQMQLDDDVQFSVYRPSQVQPERWYPLLAFAHRTRPIEDVDGGVVNPVEEVERQARVLIHDELAPIKSNRSDASFGLVRGTGLRFQLWLEEGDVNPASVTIQWHEPVHRADFRIRVPAAADGRSVRGCVRIFMGVLIAGEVPFLLQVTSTAPATLTPEARTVARPYRQIFASYSRRDSAVVEAVARYISVTGDRYLIDVRNLRSGELWERRLEQLIEEADVFQLFWSQNSMRSPFVRQEWEYALALGRDEFVRPFYWDDQLPEDTAAGLPPASLRALHFAKLAIDLPTPLPPPTRSYVDELAESLNHDDLSLSNQQQLVGSLTQLVQGQDTRDAAVGLIRRLRSRHDLYLVVAQQIDELLRLEPPAAAGEWISPEPQAAPPTAPYPPPPPATPPTAGQQPESEPPSFAPPSYEQPGYGQYGQPSGYGQPGDGYASPRVTDGRRVPILIAIVVVVVIVTLLVAFLR